MSDVRNTAGNGPSGSRSGGRENGHEARSVAVRRAFCAYLVPFGGKREFPMEIVVRFRPSQAEGGWWANATVGNVSAGARGATRQAALVALARSLAASSHFKLTEAGASGAK